MLNHLCSHKPARCKTLFRLTEKLFYSRTSRNEKTLKILSDNLMTPIPVPSTRRIVFHELVLDCHCSIIYEFSAPFKRQEAYLLRIDFCRDVVRPIIIRNQKIIKTPTSKTNFSSCQILAGLPEFVFIVMPFQGSGRVR